MKQRIFDWIRALAVKVKDFFKGIALKVWGFLKKWGTRIVNVIVLFVAYGSMNGSLLADFVVGFWLFLLLAYYIFGKIFGAEKLFKRNEE